ncbi:MAG: RNA polymerase sigma factor SigF [Solirubrobacteraceae bacterium]
MSVHPRDDPAALFARLRADGDPAAREALVERYLPLARSIAGRYRHTPQALEDLVQVASLALVKAVDGFDPERGLAFSSYAVPTIVGELKRYFRDAAWSLHLPRALKERVLLVERCERQLSVDLGHSPTVDDIAAAAGLTPEEVLDAMEARGAHDTESIEAPSSADSGLSLVDTLGDEDASLELVEDRDALSVAMARLPERERQILGLRFVQGLTQTEIASQVGVSQMQVSRILRSTLARLREDVDTGPEL